MIRKVSILLAGLLLAPAARAQADPPPAEDEQVPAAVQLEEADSLAQELLDESLPSSACPDLFGTDRERDENWERLRDLELRAWEGRHCITLVHSGALEKPRPVHYTGLELITTTCDQEGYAVALFRFEGLDEIDCPPGLYAVEPGDCLGEDTRVLVVLTDVVLVEHDHQVFYMASEHGACGPGEPPVFRMVWDSPWSMPRLQPAGSSRSRSSAAARRRRKIRRRKARARRRRARRKRKR